MRTLPPLLLLGASLLSPPAGARSLHGRLGIGVDGTAAGAPALSARYGLPMPSPAMNLLFEFDLAFAAGGDEPSQGFAGGRLLYGLVAEDNLNLYGGLAAGISSLDGETSLRLVPGAEVEFFPFGLENLGFTVGWGLAAELGASSRFSTFAGAPALGLHYYF